MSFVVAMLIQVATAPWSPPIQAHWAGDGSSLEARIEANDRPILMHGEATLTVILSSDDADFRISPFIAATRGIAFEVVDQEGKIVAPGEPIAISPAAPPLAESQLKVVASRTPLKIGIGERAINLFPKPGRYRIRAIISLISIAGRTSTYKQLRTNYVTVEVAA